MHSSSAATTRSSDGRVAAKRPMPPNAVRMAPISSIEKALKVGSLQR
jgi:hypothetical protein